MLRFDPNPSLYDIFLLLGETNDSKLASLVETKCNQMIINQTNVKTYFHVQRGAFGT